MFAFFGFLGLFFILFGAYSGWFNGGSREAYGDSNDDWYEDNDCGIQYCDMLDID
jgi:hypothetical protein